MSARDDLKHRITDKLRKGTAVHDVVWLEIQEGHPHATDRNRELAEVMYEVGDAKSGWPVVRAVELVMKAISEAAGYDGEPDPEMLVELVAKHKRAYDQRKGLG